MARSTPKRKPADRAEQLGMKKKVRRPKTEFSLTWIDGHVRVKPSEAFCEMYAGFPGALVYAELFVEGLDPANPSPNLNMIINGLVKSTEYGPFELKAGINAINKDGMIPVESGDRISLFIDQPCKVWYSIYRKPIAPYEPEEMPAVEGAPE